MAKRIAFYVPDWAADEVERYMEAQSSRGHTLAALVIDAMKKYGCKDYLAVKLMNNETDGEDDV